MRGREDTTQTEEGEVEEAPEFRFRLETDLKTYGRIAPFFLADLASTLGLGINDLHVTQIRLGCVEVTIEIRNADGAVLARLKAAASGAPDPELRQLLEKYDISELIEIKRLPIPYISQLMGDVEALDEGNSFTWLHLSDLHARAGSGSAEQTRIEDQLLEDLPELLSYWALEPDVVFFTGDLAYSGQAIEYARVRAFLDGLQARLPQRVPILMIPGNHDVTWEAVDQSSDKKLDAQLSSHRDIDNLFDDSAESVALRKQLRLRLDNYFSFAEGAADLGQPATPSDGLYYTKTLDFDGLTIGVAGLNSAWLSTKPLRGATDRQRLIVGAPQLISAGKALQDSDLRIALVHHPLDTEWYRAFDRQVHRARVKHFDFILRGHEHVAGALGVHEIASDSERIEVPAGALYSSDRGYPNSFNAIRVNLQSRRGTAFFWRYVDEKFSWDQDTVLAPKGRALFELPREVVARLEAADGRIAGRRRKSPPLGAARDVRVTMRSLKPEHHREGEPATTPDDMTTAAQADAP